MPHIWLAVALTLGLGPRCVQSSLEADFKAAGTLKSLYEFNTAAPKKNTLSGVQDAIFNQGASQAGVDGSDGGQVFVQKAGNIQAFTNISPKSGNSRVNVWTVLIDVKFTSMGKFTSLYQLSLDNKDDGEGWLKYTDVVYVGVGMHYYIGTDVEDDKYYRYVVAYDLPAQRVRYYINGRLINDAAGGRCGSCGLNGKFSLGDSALMVTDNDGEEAAAYVTTVAFWEGAISDAAAVALGPPSFGVAGAPLCAAMDELGSFITRNSISFPKIVANDLTKGVSKCGSSCCRSNAAGNLPCYSIDPRFQVNGAACQLVSDKEVCAAVNPTNKPNEQKVYFGYYCTPHVRNPAPLMEPLIAFIGGIEPESHVPTAAAFHAAIAAFFSGQGPIAKNLIDPSLTKMFYADFIGAVSKAAQQPYSLIQQVAYELVYGSRSEIRQNAITKNGAGDPLAVLQTGTYKSYVASAGLAPDFRLKRSIPIPIAVVAATGVEFCGAVARSVELGSHTMMVSAGCAGSANMQPKTRTVHSGAAAICSKWTKLFEGLKVHKFGIIWSKTPMSSFYLERFRALEGCMTSCQGKYEGELTGICLSLMLEVCVDTSPSETCLGAKAPLNKGKVSVEKAFNQLKVAAVRVIVVGLDAQTKDFHALADTAYDMGMSGPEYTWLWMGDTTGSLTSPKTTFLQTAHYGKRFDRSFVLVNSCDGEKWDKFMASTTSLARAVYPHPSNLMNTNMEMAGGVTYGVLFNPVPGFSGFMWYMREVVDGMIARAVDATWAVLLAINNLVKRNSHAPYGLPPVALLGEMENLNFEGVCGTMAWEKGVRNSATPLRVYNVYNVEAGVYFRRFEQTCGGKDLKSGWASDWGTGYVNDIEGCKTKCSANADCAGFEWRETDNRCSYWVSSTADAQHQVAPPMKGKGVNCYQKAVLGVAGAKMCDSSKRFFTVDKDACLAAAKLLLPAGKAQGRTTLQAGGPLGCSIQTGGDYAAYFNDGQTGVNDGKFTPICQLGYNNQRFKNLYSFDMIKLGKITDKTATWETPPQFPGKKLEPANHVPRVCKAGQEMKNDLMCYNCPAGKYQPKTGRSADIYCVGCKAGYVAASAGLSECTECAAGKWNNSAGTSCDACKVGSARSILDAGCGSCKKGYFQDVTGATECKACKVGEFQPGSTDFSTKCTTCATVGTGKSTQLIAAGGASDCMCPTGTVEVGTSCKPCKLGMKCEKWGMQFPDVSPNYFVKSEDKSKKDVFSTQIYLCEPKEACAGGKWGESVCRAPRSGFMCETCPDATSKNSDLEEDSTPGCQDCSDANKFLVIFAPLVALVATVFIMFESRHSPLDDPPWKIEIQGVAGQLMMFAQVMGCFLEANLLFGEPMTSFASTLTAPVSTDLFGQLPCVSTPLQDPLSIYAMQVCGPAAFMTWLLIVYSVAQLVRRNFFSLNGLLNSMGEVLVEFYISVTLAVMTPFKCYSHPNGGLSSLAIFPAVICGEGDHNIMKYGFAVFGVLAYPVSVVAITFFCTWQHPRLMLKNDLSILIRCHFLFNRWRPACYWFSIVSSMRNFALALLPMVLPEDKIDLSVGLMLICLVISIILMIWHKPRRTRSMNHLDVWINFVQIIVLGVGTMTVYGTTLDKELSSMLVVFVTSVAVVGPLMALFKLVQVVTNNLKFDIFLSHHGGEGGSAARILQIILVKSVKNKGSVFYDMDLLGFYSVIFDTMKQSKHMLNVLGQETLVKPWCVGSAAIAWRKHIPIHNVLVSSTKQLKDGQDTRQISGASGSSTSSMQANFEVDSSMLRPYGVDKNHIHPALENLLSCKPVLVDLRDGASFDQMLSTIFEQMPNVPWTMSASAASKEYFPSKKECGSEAPLFLILSDHEDMEAAAGSRLLGMLVGEALKLRGGEECLPGPAGSTPMDLLTGSASIKVLNNSIQSGQLQCFEDQDLSATDYVKIASAGRVQVAILCLTNSTLKSATQLARIGVLRKCSPQLQPIPLVIDPAFNFPDEGYFARLEKGDGLGLGEYTNNISFSEIRRALQHVMTLSVTFIDIPKFGTVQLRRLIADLLKRGAVATSTDKAAPLSNPTSVDAEASGGTGGGGAVASDNAVDKVEAVVPFQEVEV